MAVSMLLSFDVLAGPIVNCAGCTPATMANKAERSGAGRHIYWNSLDADVRGFDVSCSIRSVKRPGNDDTRDAEATEKPCHAVPFAAPQPYVDMASYLLTISRHTLGTYKASLAVPVNTPAFLVAGHTQADPTAHTYVEDHNYRHQINDRLAEHGLDLAENDLLESALDYVMSHAYFALQFAPGIEVRIDLVFSDGSKAKVSLDVHGDAIYKEDSARDSTGQSIPDDGGRQNAGTWTYASNQASDFNRFTRTISHFGGTVDTDGRDSGTIGCAWQENANDGGHLACYMLP